MKKSYLISICIIVLLLNLNLISAWEFDNIKIFNQTDRSITLKNSFAGIFPLDTIGKVTSLTPHNVNFMSAGYKEAARFEIDLTIKSGQDLATIELQEPPQL